MRTLSRSLASDSRRTHALLQTLAPSPPHLPPPTKILSPGIEESRPDRGASRRRRGLTSSRRRGHRACDHDLLRRGSRIDVEPGIELYRAWRRAVPQLASSRIEPGVEPYRAWRLGLALRAYSNEPGVKPVFSIETLKVWVRGIVCIEYGIHTGKERLDPFRHT